MIGPAGLQLLVLLLVAHHAQLFSLRPLRPDSPWTSMQPNVSEGISVLCVTHSENVGQSALCRSRYLVLDGIIYPISDLFSVPQTWLCCKSGRYFYRPTPKRSRKNALVTILLLMSGIESNPGPSTSDLRTISLGVLNSQSIVKKAALIHDVIADHRLDLLAITETWVYDDSPDVHKREAAPAGYSMVHAHRPPKTDSGKAHGGGVALIYRNDIHVKVIPSKSVEIKTFELLTVRIVNSATSLIVAIIYRPPRPNLSDFVAELSDFINGGTLGSGYIICGDLNCPGPTGTRGLVDEELLELIDSHSLKQHVHRATYHSGNLLDHILTSQDADVVKDVTVEDVGISDHCLVKCSLIGRRNRPNVVTFTYRKWKQLDLDEFRKRVTLSSVQLQPASTADMFALQLETDITGILDELIPVCTCTKRHGKCDSRWLSPEAITAKQTRRRLERRLKTTGLESVRKAYRAACRIANRCINEARRSHCARTITESSRDPRALWRNVKGLLHSGASSTASIPGLCQSTASFFAAKIAKVQVTVDSLKSKHAPLPSQHLPDENTIFDHLDLVTVPEVSKLIARLPNKTSPLDFIHTSIIKSCPDVMAPLIAHLANLSFSEGRFPDKFKLAQVSPLLKKAGLDGNDPANYRPISNLNTIGKIIERLVLARLTPHVAVSDKFNRMQSAYRKLHSTETALLKIMDDLYRIVDDKKAAVLIGLDLSAAFDTINHEILLSRLSSRFGISGSALEWMKSYLEGRSQFVKIGFESSPLTVCNLGVPQGSVLGPFLFSIYVSPVADVIASFGVQFHQYADDTQLYTAVKSNADTTSLRNLELCTAAVRDWFLYNGMLLNPDKSEVLLVGGRPQVKTFAGGSGISISGSDIKFSVQLKSLGVTLDQNLSFDQHVKNVVKASNFHIRALRHIRPMLNREVANTVACSIVSSRLDYCNSLLYGTTAKNIAKLQRVQNSLARVVSQTARREHIRPVLKDLHWLPVAERIEYKVALITRKVLTTRQPGYLANIVTEYKPSRELRSSSQLKLASRSTNKVIGERAFSCASTTVWNRLPQDIRALSNTPTFSLNKFKTRLKTYLFQRAFCS